MAEISPERLAERLAKGKAIPAILLHGADPYLRDLCRRSIVEACVPDAAREWAVQRFASKGGGWAEVFERAEMMPMLAPRQVLIVEDADSIQQLGEKSREKILDDLGAYLKSPPPFTILLLEAQALDRRQRFYKLLADSALIVELTIGDESAAMLATQMARELGVEIEREAAALLAETVNAQPARMRLELEKLASYAGETRRVTAVDVRAMVANARKNVVWDLAGKLASRDAKGALEFLQNLVREGEQPAAMIGALGWMYRKLIEARELPPATSGYQAALRLQMRPEEAELAIRNAHRIPKQQLLAGFVALAEADSRLKSSNPDPRAFMEFLIAQLTEGDGERSEARR